MEPNYEEKMPGGRAGSGKQYIDFYKQSEQHHNHVQSDQNIYTAMKERNEDIRGAAVGSTSDNQVLRQEVDQKFYSQVRADNYLEGQNKIQSQDKMREDYKRMMQDGKLGASKRRSVENSDALLNNRQNEYRQQQTGAKSALNNYPTQSSGTLATNSGVQQLKQINKNKIERDYMMENVFGTQVQQQQPFQNNSSISQQQQKRTLAKSSSQNRLLLVSPETIMSKSNPYTDIYNGEGQNHQEKNSFSDQSQGRPCSNPPSDLLYKQHLQYSSNHSTNNLQHQQKAWQLKAQSHILSHLSTKECTFCNKTGGFHSHSNIPHQCSAIFCIKDSLGLMIQNNLSKKYSTNRDYYNLKIVNDLIYNENTHIVSIFKDYLILDDINEFLKRSYTQQETKVRLPKLCSFYDKYSQVFPNYVILPESKYMFKNIQRKQKLIDEQYQLQEELAKKQHQTLLDDDRLFNSKFYNSVYRMDLSMSRQQYEDQAKSIASIAGRPQKQPMRIDQMKIDELVDRFLLKDSESNIQLITTAGLDFSGFTQQSTFINEKSTTPSKQMKQLQNSNKLSSVQNQQSKVNQQLQMIQKGQTVVGQRKESLQQKKASIGSQNQNTATKKQKASFNSTQQTKPGQNNVVPKIDTNKATMNNASSSTKTTPRLQKGAPYTGEEIQKQQIQTSPGTKEALQNYLHNCQIEGLESTTNQHLHLEVIGNQTLKLESPVMQSPQQFQKQLFAQSSSTALSQQLPANSLSGNNRQLMKSQCIMPTIQFNQSGNPKEITNLKKTTRLSGGNYAQPKGNPINNKKQNQNVSPVPATNIQGQQLLTNSSRNNIVNNSTQKSLKSVNSHAKYLSGGNDQYQRLLQQQNPYATQDTVISNNNFGSSSKKLQAQLSKQDMLLETFQSKQNHQHHLVNDCGEQPLDNDGAMTGEDCDDAGIADERFASPDIFASQEETAARKSVQSRHQLNAGGFGNPILLTSCEDNRILSQCNNYDQIKKHLEQYITISQQDNTSSNKKYVATMSSEKMQYETEKVQYNRQQMASSTGTANDQNNSRNGTAQKHFESLKQKIRGVFEVDSSVTASANKTPNKSSTHSKKSQVTNLQPTVLSQNRMSIESKDMMLMVAPQQNQGCLSSTSAAGRTLSFAQFTNNQTNYRSITNMQQRKNSNQKQETSIESKRLSQNRQSFKEIQQHQEKIKRCATGKTLSINDINQHTFGTIQNQTGAPYLQSIANLATLGNPTFIQSSTNQATKVYQQNSVQNNSQNNNSQQAANTVRVMTPSYSLASLSKLISPTTSTSPITMTVTLATQGRGKQPIKKQATGHPISNNPSLVPSSSHQNFLISDKNNKIISNSKHQVVNSLAGNKSSKGLSATQKSTQIQQKGIQTRLQQSNSQENFSITPRGIQVAQQQQQQQQQQPQQKIFQQLQQQQPLENSQNLSCTISTENNSTTKAVESKNPKFMRTIEEYSVSNQPSQYNTMLSASMGHRKSGTGLSGSISQAQLDMKQKQKIQTVVNSNQASIKRGANMIGANTVLSSSASVSHFKSPSQQIHSKKQSHGKYI